MSNLVHYEPTDFEYIVSALAYAHYEGLTLSDIYATLQTSSNGKEFDAGVCSMIKLKDMLHGTTKEKPPAIA